MRLIQHILAVVGVAVSIAAVHASPSNPQDGVDYQTLAQPQATEANGKVEVIEFMWYNCPHCAAYNPAISAWAKKQGDKIDFKKVPIAFGPAFIPQQKLLFTLEALGLEEQMSPKVFQTIHVDRRRVDTDKTILAFIEKQGIDKQKFSDTYNSFGVQTKLRRAQQLQDGYNIEGVPIVAVGGKYLTSPAMMAATLANQPEAQQQNASLQVLDFLVAKAAAEQKSSAKK